MVSNVLLGSSNEIIGYFETSDLRRVNAIVVDLNTCSLNVDLFDK